MNARSKRSYSPLSPIQVFGLFIRIPWLRIQLLVTLLVALAAGGWLLFGIASLVDLLYPILPDSVALFRRVGIGGAALILCALAYGHFIERRWIEVTRTRIPTAKLPAGTPPIRIVHLSDFHCTADDLLEKKVPGLVHQMSPDLILMTGDYLGSLGGRPTLNLLLCSLRSASGNFAVIGNHETWYTPHLDLFKETPVVELDNEVRRISIRGIPLCLVGIRVEEEEEGKRLFQGLAADTINIVLYHYPELLERASAYDVDLVLAGHTHGGQVALPYFGAIVTFSKGWKRYERGLYRKERTALYVNRGLGSDGGLFPAVRFFSRPEIAILDLIPEDPREPGAQESPGS